MYKFIFTLTLLFLSANITAFADDAEQVITLKDGSQIKGQLAGINNGVYTVKTPIIGDVHVAASDVASITNGAADGTAAPVAAMPAQASGAPSNNMDAQIAASQQKLMSNPQAMAELQEMAQDPEIMQALQDPALVQAVTSHNYQAVQSNPQVQALMSNPRMQAFLQKIAAEQQQNSSSQ